MDLRERDNPIHITSKDVQDFFRPKSEVLLELSGNWVARFFAVFGTVITLTVLFSLCDKGFEAYNQHVQSQWATGISDKLDGQQALLEKERFYPQVEVVAAGRDDEERRAMRILKTPVKVRTYPSTYQRPASQTNIIGEVAQWTKIRNVILTASPSNAPEMWGAFRCSDIQGQILKQRKNYLTSKPKPICVINADNLQKLPDGPVDSVNEAVALDK